MTGDIGMALALFGAPALLYATRRFGGDTLGLALRLSLWALAAITWGIAEWAMNQGDRALGLLEPGWRTLVGAVAATFLTLAGAPIFQYIQEKVGTQAIAQNDIFQALIARSIRYRLFLVATAAVTEEILYRGFAVGVGAQILGSRSAAAALSIVVFVGGHFRWGVAHMLSVTWAAVVLTALFVITHDLWACIAAHAAIDLMGLVIAPAAMARRGLRSRPE